MAQTVTYIGQDGETLRQDTIDDNISVAIALAYANAPTGAARYLIYDGDSSRFVVKGKVGGGHFFLPLT